MFNNEEKRDIYTVNGGEKVINSVDFQDGTICYEIEGNLKYFYAIKNGHMYRLEDSTEWLVNTYKYDKNSWTLVGENENPYDLIENEVLTKGDIIRFKSTLNDDIIIAFDELELFDPSGIYIIGETLDDFTSRVENGLLLPSHEHEWDSEEDDDEDEDVLDLDNEMELSIIPASSILEYLREYGDIISLAAELIDRYKNLK